MGHLLGAAGAVEAIATVMALHTQVLPPTMNLSTVDPDFGFNLVANKAQTTTEYVLFFIDDNVVAAAANLLLLS